MQGRKGRVAIVTGGGDGIGRGIARRYAREGAKVGIAELNQTNGEAVADEIGRDFGGSAICIPTDVRDRAQLLGMIYETVRRFGSVDILVNNAWGGGSFSRAEPKTDGALESGISQILWDAFCELKDVFPDNGRGS